MGARKYGQKGYMEDEPRERRPSGGPRPERDGPRGRGLGAPSETVFKCARCGARAELGAGTPVDETCSECGSDLHTCTNCRHFDTGSPMECRLDIEERIAAKSKRNECALFEPREIRDFAADAGSGGDAKKAFDSLFDF